MVAIDGTEPKNCVETFKNLCWVTDRRSKTPNIFPKVCQQMQLDLDDYFVWCYFVEGIKNISNENHQITLRHKCQFVCRYVKIKCTIYSSILSISCTQRTAPSAPTAWTNACSFGVTRSWIANRSICMRDLKCLPIRLLRYWTMYVARNGGIVSPEISVDCNRIANIARSLSFQEVWTVCQTYFIIPRRMVWRISTGVSCVGSNPVEQLR